MFKNYIDADERRAANKQLPRLLFEGLLLGGTGLGVLALIFEIAADAFSVAAYQTLLAIHGAGGYHTIAIWAFIVLSALLFLGIVPAYKAGAYLRPNAGGSGPLVEAIGPPRMRWLSWAGTSLFFLDAILTIIISSISAADVTMLVLPELAPYRIILAEAFAFFIMAVLVAMGPQRAVPIFLIGGGAFTIFTLGALSLVGFTAVTNPEWSFLTPGIVARLEAQGVVEHAVRAQQDVAAIGTVLVFQLFFRSMSSAMLGFSGYEVIPASGKHAAMPKWKVINTALTLAAVFLIGTGVVQLYAAKQWDIPATEGYSTLLIEYEIIAAQTLGRGINPDDVVITAEDVLAAEAINAATAEREITREVLGGPEETVPPGGGDIVPQDAHSVALIRSLDRALVGTVGESFLIIAGTLLAIILLLAQGGGYVGGSAVAANAAQLGRLPSIFSDDRIGVVVIWVISAILIPIIREVVIVEAYYAFGFVTAFAITSTTVFFVRKEAMLERGIQPGSGEARSLRFAGLRGMIASYIMLIVLVTQKTSALPAILLAAGSITLLQLYTANGGFNFSRRGKREAPAFPAGTKTPEYEMGIERAHDQARQRGVVRALEDLIDSGAMNKFNVGPNRIRRLVSYLYNVDPVVFEEYAGKGAHEHIEEPNESLEATYQTAYAGKERIARRVEDYSHFGIFTFIHNYHLNWVAEEHGRNESIVQQVMLDILFPQTPHEKIWKEFCAFEPAYQPEPIWQFSRMRYLWAKDQWPNLSGRVTTIWTLQDLGLVSSEVDVKTVISVANGRQFKVIHIHMAEDAQDVKIEKESVSHDDVDLPAPGDENEGADGRGMVIDEDGTRPVSHSDYETDTDLRD
ncbi:MAG: hypothetical protein KDD92_05420 [Caldilineaceae bacterium]|nr:hypothetical protein [Caldilineaceae bacterium]